VCSKPTQNDIIANVKKCLPGWHISLDKDGVLMLRTEDVAMTVSGGIEFRGATSAILSLIRSATNLRF